MIGCRSVACPRAGARPARRPDQDEEEEGMPLSDSTRNQLSQMIGSDRVVLFMKGNRGMPQCGFSATVVGILDELVPAYKTVDVLADPAVRDGIKELSNWPTIPQLYVGGEFVGGCDIVKD